MTNLEQSITEMIELIQTSECLKCKQGQVLIKLRDIRDSLEAPEVVLPVQSRGQSKLKLKLQAPTERVQTADPEKAPTVKPQVAGKACNRCGYPKPISEYNVNKGCRDGYENICKKCRKEIATKRKALKKQAVITPAPPAPAPKTYGNFGRVNVALNFHCDLCKAKFLTQKQLDDHNVERHGAEIDYECDVCSKPFVSAEALQNHKELRHG